MKNHNKDTALAFAAAFMMLILGFTAGLCLSIAHDMSYTKGKIDELRQPLPNAVVEEYNGAPYVVFDYEGMHYVIQFEEAE